LVFNNLKPTEVKYIIEDFNEIPKGFFKNIEMYPNFNKTKCPAVTSTNKKLYYVEPSIDLDIEFGLNKDGKEYYKYDFTSYSVPVSAETHEYIRYATQVVNNNNLCHLQLMTPYAFVTDNKDIEVISLPVDIETINCKYVPGAIKPYNWIRALNSSWAIEDISKPGVVKFRKNKPYLLLNFNKPVNLSYTEMTDIIKNYYDQSNKIVNYSYNLDTLMKHIFKRRPNKLLWYNPRMDFIIGFLLGYFLKEVSSYLKRISKYDLDSNIDKEWDFLSRDDLP